MQSYFKYWGKAKRDPEASGPDYHLLPYHCLDVAAVGWVLLEPSGKLCYQLAKSLGVKPEWLQNWFCYCLALHDLGKFFRAFQNLAPNLSDELVSFDGRCRYERRHDTLGYAFWGDAVKRMTDIIPTQYAKKTDLWMQITCGHHGKPPEQFKAYKKCLTEEDESAAQEFVRDVSHIFKLDFQPLTDIDKKVLRRCSWQLAGLAVLADWLGSSQKYFHYHSAPLLLQKYWENIALPCAQAAIQQANISSGKINPFQSIKQQFDFIKTPTPLQALTESIEIPDSAQLFILEDVTGAGKTEAALVLVHRLLSQGLAHGLYVGLPTMATANGMYRRMAKCYRNLFSDSESPSLVLAHGASQLSQDFQETVALHDHFIDKNYEAGELSASAYCNKWLADNRKKALLADVGVGTIDQALLGVLPAKHQALRLYGLADKILLVDEVHAFDPYMRRLLCALLSAHAAQGGSVILLSATLPLGFRRQLVAAYASGSGRMSPLIDSAAQYPWVTQFNTKRFSERAVATRACVARQVSVQRINSEDDAIQKIQQTVDVGHCICWIRNTVKDASAAYMALQQLGVVDQDKLTLFHSRYAMIDRQTVENDVLSRFGKGSTASDRAGQILIATQVVEQSLDLDFDVMISDLAPIDLLIQRAGRLQRHSRSQKGDVQVSEQRDKPCMYVLAPDPAHAVNSDWLRSLLPGTQAVYANVGQLWLTLKSLLAKQGFTMPQDARELIESVYGDQAQGSIPEVLLEATEQAKAQQNAEAGMGTFNLLKLEKGYTELSALHNGGWADEINIPTRLGGDTVTCVLVRKLNGHWQPYAQADNHQWALSQISLPRKEWEKAKRLIARSVQQELDSFKDGSNALRWLELLPLEGDIENAYDSSKGWCVLD